MIASPLNSIFTHTDERFTVNLLKLSLVDSYKLMMCDVHPPLYYLINYIFINICSLLHISNDVRHIAKFVSLIPYIIILTYSGTRIKKDYGWFTSGLFTFTLATMSCFYIYYVTARMYSWELLLMFFSFIYFKEILTKPNKKSWILFILFNILGMYTQYFIFFIVAAFYIMLLINIYLSKLNWKIELKTILKSICLSIILYIPGIYILFNQLFKPGHANGKQITTIQQILDIFISYSTDFTIKNTLSQEITLLIKILALILLLTIITISMKKYFENRTPENYYLMSGNLLFPITILLSISILPLVFGGLNARYLLPVIGIFWFATSILLTKITNKNIFTVILITILLLSFCGLYYNFEITDQIYKEQTDEDMFFNEINNNNSVVIYTHINGYHNYHSDLNNSKEYSNKDLSIPYQTNCTIEKNISKIIEENPNKKVYILQTTTNGKIKMDKKIKYKEVYKLPQMSTYFFELSKSKE